MVDGTELSILALVTGPLYVRRRDQLLARTPDAAELLAHAKNQPDKHVEIVATILAGWTEHRATYEAFLADLSVVDIAAEEQKITGVGGVVKHLAAKGAREHGAALLPLCWEQVLKLSLDLPGWQVHTFLRVMSVLADPSSIEPLIWFVEETADADLLDAAHQALLKLPYQGFKDRFVEAKGALARRVFVFEDLLARIKASAKKT